ncbi:hypothetical protein [Mangrovimonas cancribranchiae]|uniref:Auto-transporter adhesin head GIN domain-containing protein n=1 Tax=Mangrovimonas cancribranchiae TaxID=3080055 RepID=A0AAU6P445_9FLAO
MKKSHIVLIIVFFCVGFFGFIFIKSLFVDDTITVDSCVTEREKITKISKGTSNDIVFEAASGDKYYINRGLDHGLNLDSLNAKVLNKTVTLHLAKLWLGTSEHIAQLQVDNKIIYTEFD